MVYAYDLSVFRWFNSFAGVTPFWDGLITFFAVYLWWIIAASFFFYFLIAFLPKFAPNRLQAWLLCIEVAASAFIARFVITEAIRFFYNRPRPFMSLEEVSVLKYQLLDQFNTVSGSFPSGHASLTFAIAAAVSPRHPKTGLLLFAAAFLVGMGRISAGVHWPSDIIGGAIIGIAAGFAVFGLSRYARRKRPPENR